MLYVCGVMGAICRINHCKGFSWKNYQVVRLCYRSIGLSNAMILKKGFEGEEKYRVSDDKFSEKVYEMLERGVRV